MPLFEGSEKLPEHDRGKLRMLQAKAMLGKVGFNLDRYGEIQKELIRVFPELNTIENGRKLKAHWNLHKADSEFIAYFERLAEFSKEVA